jgi:chemotaxis protein histidine kinase CheA
LTGGGTCSEGDLRLGKGSWQWVQDEAGNPHRGTWRCFATCVDDVMMTDVLRSQDDEFDPEKLAGFADLDVAEKKVVTERLDAAAANKEEVDAAQKLARAERKREEREEAEAAAAKKAEKMAAKKAAARAAKKGHQTVSTKGSSLVPCDKCGEHINKNFASMHECKKPKGPSLVSFFGAAASNGKAAKLAAAAQADEEEQQLAASSKKRKDGDEDEDAPKKKKKKKKVKEEGQPKGALSAYMFFTKSVRQEVTAANPEKKITELATVYGEMWKKMSDDEKTPFLAEQAADKARYAAEMEEFSKPEAKAAREEAAASKAAAAEEAATAKKDAKDAEKAAKKAEKAAEKAAKPKKAPAPKKKKVKEIKKPAPIVYVTLEKCGCSVRQGWEWAHECKKVTLPAKTPLRDLFKDAKSPPADAASPPDASVAAADTAVPMTVE